MSEPFLTIAKNTSNEMVIKKSRFICSVARVSTEDEAQQFIEQVSTENRKATHNCYAYMVGDRDQIQRESDNGEPSGTAGVPILESLQLAKIHNVVAVVTRYFGGIKLGAGGLIRAYSNSATNAIHKAELVQRIKQAVLEITINYSQHDSLLHYLNEQGIEVADEQFSATVQTNVYVDEEKVDSFTEKLINRFNDQLTIKKGTSRDHEIPYLTN
ncbi:YigZ family protein [Limosilactobacillus sp. Sa3CUN2]|uniref:YigZ family protein n=1 Tax=Limosilactobacillus avistercoris TaxID=2762243 RepID=A0ABR8PDT8_9LACO|nr:YigZ family protein [Limosilactobacillus avistercoris]MBD7895455.1 YigZ family protein [Limosilactobacillus avistercoris]